MACWSRTALVVGIRGALPEGKKVATDFGLAMNSSSGRKNVETNLKIAVVFLLLVVLPLLERAHLDIILAIEILFLVQLTLYRIQSTILLGNTRPIVIKKMFQEEEIITTWTAFLSE